MASLVLTDAKVFIAGHDLSGQMSATALEYAADLRDATTFGATTRIRTGGIKSVVGNHQGLWDSASTTAVDPVLFARVGTEDVPVVVGATGSVGDVAYLLRAVHASYTVGAQVGDILPFTVSMEGTGGQPLVRGKFLHNGTNSGAITGTAVQLGAITATQYLYAVLHVFAGSGSHTVTLQSSADQAFTSPTTRITFTNVPTGTAVASEWAARVAGPITDTWWRVISTASDRISAVAVGIQ